MGLDMYLTKETYVKNWEYNKKEEKIKITILKDNKKHPNIKTERICNVIEDIACWRKANAIHNWFVKNIQSENDNCEKYCVSREDLKNLLDIVNEVLKHSRLVSAIINNGWTSENGKTVPIKKKGKKIENPTKAKELLPTGDGFFFGSTDYDQYYYEDLKYTQKVLKDALKEKGGDFYYSANW